MRWGGRKKWRSGGEVEEKGWEEEKKRRKGGEEEVERGRRRGTEGETKGRNNRVYNTCVSADIGHHSKPINP